MLRQVFYQWLAKTLSMYSASILENGTTQISQKYYMLDWIVQDRGCRCLNLPHLMNLGLVNQRVFSRKDPFFVAHSVQGKELTSRTFLPSNEYMGT